VASRPYSKGKSRNTKSAKASSKSALVLKKNCDSVYVEILDLSIGDRLISPKKCCAYLEVRLSQALSRSRLFTKAFSQLRRDFELGSDRAVCGLFETMRCYIVLKSYFGLHRRIIFEQDLHLPSSRFTPKLRLRMTVSHVSCLETFGQRIRNGYEMHGPLRQNPSTNYTHILIQVRHFLSSY
jgi:hypothetical protein